MTSRHRTCGREPCLRHGRRARPRLARHPARRVLRAARPVGLGQDHLPAPDRGLRPADSGRILLDGEDVTDVPPYERDVNTVFQDYALFPHMTVAENVAYGLRVRGVAAAERRRRAAEMLDLVRLGSYGDAPSGAALRRPAAARRAGACADQPAEGAAARRAARRARPQAARGDADRAEEPAAAPRHHVRVRHARPGRGAQSMADRVAVFNQGRIEQLDTPREPLHAPAHGIRREFRRQRQRRRRAGCRAADRPSRSHSPCARS